MFNITYILKKIPHKEPMVILIRHAEKHKETINKKNFFCNGITSSGRLATEKLAKHLCNIDIARIKTSPVKRCMMTAELFSQSYKNHLYIQKTNLLGNPGAFIRDAKIASDIFINTSDIYSIIEQYYSKKLLPGFIPIDIGTNKILRDITRQLRSQKTTLYITHDFILGTLLASTISNDLFTNNKINYLNGICFTLDNKNSLAVYLENKVFKI